MRQPRELLTQLLRPAGGGVYVVSTGASEQRALQERLYGVAGPSSGRELERRFEEELDRIASARVVVLGVPSDVGAGFLRGANMGPQGIRSALLDAHPSWPSEARALGVVDAGDVLVCPQLLHDSMLSDEQRRASQDALYPGLDEPSRRAMPVSPLSMEARALEAILAINPNAKPLVLGGDHSCAWPVAEVLAKTRREPFGIVQVDAHTDLLEQRLGVRYCFATWSYHANDLVGRDGKLVQVGVRASRHDRSHWESSLDVRQFWASECSADPDRALDAIVTHVEQSGVRSVYFSNDIDGTDARFADATGTPEPNGLTPDFVVELIRRLGERVSLCAADVMEVAPSIPRSEGGRERTLETAVRYFRQAVLSLTVR